MVFPSGNSSRIGLVVAILVTLASMLLPTLGVDVPDELKVGLPAALVYYIGLLSRNSSQEGGSG